jgi:uncharacterized protein (DUF1778 family)
VSESSGSVDGRRGRRPRAEAPAEPFRIRLSPEERRRVGEAARVNQQSLADFARDALVTAAEDCLDDDRG